MTDLIHELKQAGVTYAISQHPKPVGYWVLYKEASLKTQFAVYHKPTDEQIKNTEQLLGWHWLEA